MIFGVFGQQRIFFPSDTVVFHVSHTIAVDLFQSSVHYELVKLMLWPCLRRTGCVGRLMCRVIISKLWKVKLSLNDRILYVFIYILIFQFDSTGTMKSVLFAAQVLGFCLVT